MAAAKTTRRAIDEAVLGYGVGDFFADLFTGGSVSISKGYRGINPLTGRPVDDKEAQPTGTLHDITKTDVYKAQQARVADMTTRGQSADQARDKALAALMALRSAAPAQGAAPIAVTVPSFSLGRRRY